MVINELGTVTKDPTCGMSVDEANALFSDNIKTFTEGDRLYDAMLQNIYSAKREILIESYIFNLDPIGEAFIIALNHKAAEGLLIKIHLDAVGSRHFKQGPSFKKHLHRNISLKWFNRWNWKKPLEFNVRNHRKLLIIDRETVFVGGYNIHRQSSRKYFGMSRWRDTHIMVKSDAAQIFSRYFEALWNSRQHNYLGPLSGLDVIPNISRKCRYILRCRLNTLLDMAQNKILCTTPYFVPDEFILKGLIRAASRGVDVRLLVPYESDHPMINALAVNYYHRLVNAGIKVFAYQHRLIHAKTLVIDSNTVMIGSANMDYRSLFINHELMCIFSSPSLAKIFRDIFIADGATALLITPMTKFNIKSWWLWRPLASLLKHWI